MSYLGINLKHDQDLYTERDTGQLRDITEEPNERRDTCCSWVKRLSILIVLTLTILVYRLKAILVKIPRSLFFRNQQVNFKT